LALAFRSQDLKRFKRAEVHLKKWLKEQ